jgi:hypothetical protein
MYLFENFFFQRWSFFAPPPESNNRLYYLFTNKATGKQTAYEALAPIFEKKREKAPFNSKEEALDYILSGNITNIVDASRDLIDVSKLTFPDSSIMFHLKKAHKEINDLGLAFPAIQTLFNYGVIIAKKQNVDLDNSSVKIIITQIEMPKFIDRHKLIEGNYKGKEEKLFETTDLPLNSYAK